MAKSVNSIYTGRDLQSEIKTAIYEEFIKITFTLKCRFIFKDIAFSLPFLHCCPSSLSFQTSLCHVWTPAAQKETEKKVHNDKKVLESTAQESARQRLSLTFLPPEDVRSGFTESAFSLLDDLDLLLFSFSADSGESQEGLVLLLFLEASKNKMLAYINFYFMLSLFG